MGSVNLKENLVSTAINGVDYGPLHQLIGTWRGEKGLDMAPEPDGEDKHAYYDEITFIPSGATPLSRTHNLKTVAVRDINTGNIIDGDYRGMFLRRRNLQRRWKTSRCSILSLLAL
jgi:hypothetical protein